MAPDRRNASLLLDGNLEAGRGANVAIHAGDERVTYEELAQRVARTGHLLHELGVRREERVLLVLDDTPALPATFLAAMRIGAVPVPVSTLDRIENYRHYLDDSYARVVVAEAELVPTVHEALDGRSDAIVLAANGSASGALSLEERLADHEDELAPAATHPDDMAFWLYSSGSTGRPKGVVHLHHDIAVTCESYAHHVLAIAEGDVTFSTTKLFHAYGLGNNLSFPYSVGAASVLMKGPTRPARVLETVERFRPTIFFSVPALYRGMTTEPRADLSSVRLCVSAAEALPPSVQVSWEELYGLEIVDGIGSTEMLHIYCSNRPGAVRPGTSGEPVPGYELRIVDDEGVPVPDGVVGNLLVSGDSRAAYYWHNHDKTKRSMLGDWYATGDRYRRTEDGDYVFEGRADDMLKVGGLWVAPEELEHVLLQHESVREAAVVGVTIADASRIKAVLVLAEEPPDRDALADELRALCKARLRRYEYPHVVEFVDELPRTLSGKLQRFKLREHSG